MRDPGFGDLRKALFAQGIAASYADRLVMELREHHLDLVAEGLAAGDSPERAESSARHRLGNDVAIIAQVLARPELRGRWSSGVRAALKPLQLAFAPLGPQCLGGAVTAGPAIARWSVSIGLGTVLTLGLLFGLARTIALGF
jgi:hypothetical protein